MKKSVVSAFSLLFLLSTTAGAQTTGTTGRARPEPARTATVASDYQLVRGDRLRIEVYKDEQLSQSVQIRPDGKITLPLVGDLTAAGKTPAELRASITEELRAFVKSPALDVTVIVVETVPMTVSVIGEVRDAGPKPISGETSILQVLAMAGGFTEWAKRKDIRVLRTGPTGETSIAFNYNDAVNGRGKTLMLRPGDIVIVP